MVVGMKERCVSLTPAFLSYSESLPSPLPAATFGIVSSMPCLLIAADLTQFTKTGWVTPRVWAWEICFLLIFHVTAWSGKGREVLLPHPSMSEMAERAGPKVIIAEICSWPTLVATLRNEALVPCFPGQHRRTDPEELKRYQWACPKSERKE